MEKQIALVNKTTGRVENVLVVDFLDKEKIKAFETADCDVVAVKDSIPYLNGLWDGKEFSQPTEDYLIEIGLVQPVIDDQTDLG